MIAWLDFSFEFVFPAIDFRGLGEESHLACSQFEVGCSQGEDDEVPVGDGLVNGVPANLDVVSDDLAEA